MPASWPIEGTTGYEAARAISRILTDAEGLGRLDEVWRRETGREGSFHDALIAAKNEVIRQELAAEMHQLIDMARSAMACSRPSRRPRWARWRRISWGTCLRCLPRCRPR